MQCTFKSILYLLCWRLPTYQIRSDGAGGKFTRSVPLILCNCSCNVMFLLVMFFFTHSLSAILATKSDLKMPSTNRALKPGKGGNSGPGVVGPEFSSVEVA